MPPLFIGGPAYISYPGFVTSETVVVSEPWVIEREVIVERPVEVEREVIIERPAAQPPPPVVPPGEDEHEGLEVIEQSDEPKIAPMPEEPAGGTGVPRAGSASRISEEAGPTAAPSLPIEQLQQMMVDGTRLFGEGRYEEAADLFAKTAEADPNNVDAVLALAVARFATGHYGQSAGLIRQGVKMLPEVVDTVFDLRDRYGKIEDFEQQVQALELWVQGQPADLDAHVVLGFVYHFTGQRPWAAEVFNYVKQASPPDAPLADVFLNAAPLEDAAPADGDDDPGTPGPAEPREGEPPGEPAQQSRRAGIRPPADGAHAASAPLYEGRLSHDKHAGPQERTTVDGIVVKLKKTHSNPARADLELRVGNFRERYDKAPVGKRIIVFGESDAMYVLEVTAIDPRLKAMSFSLQAMPRGKKTES